MYQVTSWLPLVCSTRGGLLRDCGHGTGRRRHTRSSTIAIEWRPRQWSWGRRRRLKAEGEDDKDYTPLSDAEKDEMFHNADEIKTVGNEARSPLACWGICWTTSTSSLSQNSESRGFHALDEKGTRQSWRSSVDLMCSAVTRVQLSEPRTRMQ
jgi:hypothetical protein